MRAYFRNVLDTLSRLVSVLEGMGSTIARHCASQVTGVDLEARISAIEIGIAKFEAEIEAQVTKAQAEHRNARSAEERQKTAQARAGSGDGDNGIDMEDIAEAYRVLGIDPSAEFDTPDGVRPVSEEPSPAGSSVDRLKAIRASRRAGGA